MTNPKVEPKKTVKVAPKTEAKTAKPEVKADKFKAVSDTIKTKLEVTVPPISLDTPTTPAEVKAISSGKLANAIAPPSMEGVKYTAGPMFTKYNPRKEHTIKAWEKVQDCINKNKGVANHTMLCDVLSEHFSRVGENHHDFIGYMVRRHSLQLVA
jgi:hypothetical protein